MTHRTVSKSLVVTYSVNFGKVEKYDCVFVYSCIHVYDVYDVLLGLCDCEIDCAQ